MLNILFISLFTTNFTIELDEIYANNIMTSLSDSKVTAFICSRYEKRRPIAELYLFHHEMNKAHLVVDGRLYIDLNTKILPQADGFLLLTMATRSVYFLDREGAFQNKKMLGHVSGFESDFRPVFGCSYRSHLAISYREAGNDDDLFLGELDLKRNRFRVLHAESNPAPYSYWKWIHNHWLLVNPERGLLKLVDHHFSTVKTLLPAQKPHLVVKNQKIAKLLKERGASPYASLLAGPFEREGTLSFWHYSYPEKKPFISQVLIEGGRLHRRKDRKLVMGVINGEHLIYDKDEEAFSLVRK